jgi:putative ABC transport system substrate-binding protein
LRERGYVDGQSIAIESRHGAMDRLPDLAAELVRLRVDAIVTVATPAALAAKQATSTIPIVMTLVGDPVGSGLVASLARPGGNVTGLSLFSPEVFPKALELLKETVPRVSRVAVLMDPTNPAHVVLKNDLDAAGKVLGVNVQRIDVRSAADLDGAFAAALRQRAGAFFVFPLRLAAPDLQRIVEFAVENRMPTLASFGAYVEAGGLMSYGPNFRDQLRRAGIYIDKILKGAKPADLPVEQPTMFELVINLKTAKALGLTIPQSVLIRADQLIQ